MLQQIREHLHQALVDKYYDNPSNTTLVLLSHIFKQPKSYLLMHDIHELTLQEEQTLQDVFDQIRQGIPLPYILGEWEFFGKKFLISPDVLIPRPETELLVEKALEIAQTSKNPRIVDVGTGSGAIILSLASQIAVGTFFGSDVSRAALNIAHKNAIRFGLTQISLLQADLLSPFQGQFDLICANLPYIPRQKLSNLDVARSEPILALDGGDDGLLFIRKIITQASSRLAPKGTILLEIEASLGDDALTFARTIFPKARCKIIEDLSGHDRILEIHSG